MVISCFFTSSTVSRASAGRIGGHGASFQRVSPKTRPKEARRMLNAGVALFAQGFIARMPLSKPRLGCRRIFSCVSSATAATKQVWTAQLWVGPNKQSCFLVMWIWPKKRLQFAKRPCPYAIFFEKASNAVSHLEYLDSQRGKRKQNTCLQI